MGIGHQVYGMSVGISGSAYVIKFPAARIKIPTLRMAFFKQVHRPITSVGLTWSRPDLTSPNPNLTEPGPNLN